MKPFTAITIMLFIMFFSKGNLYFTYSYTSDGDNLVGYVSNMTEPYNTLEGNSRDLTTKYDSDQINDIIYRLYEDYRMSNNTDIGHYMDIATLIDVICSDEFYESSIEACDIVTELPIE